MKRRTVFWIVWLLAAAVALFWRVEAQAGALQFDFLLSQVRSASGGALVSGKVYFYATGTSTPKAVYLDIAKSQQAANPYTLDANATAQLYGDGLYRVVIKTAAGATVYDRDPVLVQGPTAVTSVLATYLNVMDSPYGAVGDGTTDDTTAIQSALNAAASGTFPASARGGSVFLPNGDYKITSTLTMKPGTHLIGESPEGARIMSYISNNTDIIKFDADSWDNTAYPKNVLESFSIISKANNAAGDAIKLTGSTNTHSASIRNVWIWGDRGASQNFRDGVSMARTHQTMVENVHVRDATRYGFHLSGTNNSVATLQNNYTQESGADGYRLNGSSLVVMGNESYDDEGYGLYLGSVKSTHVVGNSFKISTLENVYVYQSEGVALDNNYIVSDHVDGIEVDAGTNISIRNNSIRKSGSPTGYCINMTNSPTSIRIEGGYEEAFASGTYSDETWPDVFLTTGANYNYLRYKTFIGRPANLSDANGLLDVYGTASIGAGTRTTGAPDLELTGDDSASFFITRNANADTSRIRFKTQPTTYNWDIGVPVSSTEWTVYDAVNSKTRLTFVPGVNPTTGITINGTSGDIGLVGASITLTGQTNVNGLAVFGGHVAVNHDTAPTISACGGSPVLSTNSTDYVGTVVTGSGATGCVITFHEAFVAIPTCVVTAETSSSITSYSLSTAAITVVGGASVATHWICYERQ